MAAPYRELLDFFLELEGELGQGCPGSIDYFPVVRSFIYFSERPTFSTAIGARPNLDTVYRALDLVRCIGSAALQPLRRPVARQLFVAPARHRNVPVERGLCSKHLDSLRERYGDGSELVWEVGDNPAGPRPGPSLPTDVARVAVLNGRLRRTRDPARRVAEVAGQVRSRGWPQLRFSTVALARALTGFDFARRYYRALFRKSPPERAFFVVYYSLRQAPMISALNDLGVRTIEYQHGIQSNIHPLYTHWDHLERRPASMPDEVLVWDEVSRRRIASWAEGLGMGVEVTGNLWYTGERMQRAAQAGEGGGVLVALQHYPDYFNPAILDAARATPHLPWLFREHPLYRLSAGDRKSLAVHDRVRIIGPDEESLDASLARASCCITGFSTVGIEALLYGRTAIFTHETAREGLADYFDGARCHYAETADDIRSVLDAL